MSASSPSDAEPAGARDAAAPAMSATSTSATPAARAAPASLPPVRAGHYRPERWDSDESVGFLMKVALASLKSALEERFAAQGLTDAQWQPLMALAERRGSTPSDVARRLNCDTGALTRMLDRLEEKGLVARERSCDDRRVVNLTLTPDGERAARVVPHVLADVLNAHLEDFDAAEVELLKSLLRRVIAAGLSAGRRGSGKESA